MAAPTTERHVTSQVTPPARMGKEASGRFAALRFSHTAHVVGAALMSAVFVLACSFFWARGLSHRVDSNNKASIARAQNLQSQVNRYAESCAGKNTCKTFPFARASQMANLYAFNCFNYSAQSGTVEQQGRLNAIPGSKGNCGWDGNGDATPAFIQASSPYQLNVPQAGSTQDDPDLGITGVTVVLAGEPDALNYVVPINTDKTGLQLAARGAFYSSPPTTLIRSCNSDSVFKDTSAMMSRLQSMEAGRVRTPNINPQDYLIGNRTIGTFGPSIQAITVDDLTVCQGPSDTLRTVVAHETFKGPTPGSSFAFTLGYVMEKTDKWYIQGWGPVLGADQS